MLFFMIKMNRKYFNKTFDECFQEFLLEHCTLKNMREDTKKYYIENMKYGFYKYYDKNTNINKFTQDNVTGYILYLQNKNIKDTTINIYLKALKTILIFFKRKFWVDENITVQLVREDKQQVEGYTDQEISILIKSPNMKEVTFAQYRNWVIVNFLCCTAARRSTIINIHKEDLNLENGYCKFRHTKNRKPLTVPITLSMVNILKEYIEYLPVDCPYLFPTVNKQKIVNNAYNKYAQGENFSVNKRVIPTVTITSETGVKNKANNINGTECGSNIVTTGYTLTQGFVYILSDTNFETTGLNSLLNYRWISDAEIY